MSKHTLENGLTEAETSESASVAGLTAQAPKKQAEQALQDMTAEAERLGLYDDKPQAVSQAPAEGDEKALDPANAPGTEKIWSCKIGGRCAGIPSGSDAPMRAAARLAFIELTGYEPEFIFSGWGAELTEGERAAHENREPAQPQPKHTEEPFVTSDMLRAALDDLRANHQVVPSMHAMSSALHAALAAAPAKASMPAPSDEHLMSFLTPWVIADDPTDRADFLAALRAALNSQAPAPVDKEAAAKAIYELFPGAENHPWVPGGNSLMQDKARRYVRVALDAAQAPAVKDEQPKWTEPAAWLVLDKDGSLVHAAAWCEAAHEHISDAITEYGIDEAATWIVRPAFTKAPAPSKPEGTATPPTDAELERQTGEPHIAGWPLYSGLPSPAVLDERAIAEKCAAICTELEASYKAVRDQLSNPVVGCVYSHLADGAEVCATEIRERFGITTESKPPVQNKEVSDGAR